MKALILIFCGIVISGSAWSAGWDQRIVRTNDGRDLDVAQLAQALASSRYVVLGEKHQTAAIQLAEARAVRETVGVARAESRFDLAWEFLNHTDTPRIDEGFAKVRRGELDVVGFIHSMGLGSGNDTYSPVLEAVRDLNGALLGVNLSREQKAPVVKSGIGAADPALVPAGYERGDAAYLERFSQTMQGHATPDQLSNYFDAQCLTDDVMADQIATRAHAPLSFLVTGSFHSDYRSGVVARLLHRAPGESVAVVRFIDASDYTESELTRALHDPRYGDVGDYVWFVNEPSSAAHRIFWGYRAVPGSD